MTTATITQPDVYTRVTNKIIEDLEKGQLTWRKPWSSEHLAENVSRPLRANDVPYTGINTIMLWATAAEKGYTSQYWMTYKQASEMKAQVRKGEKATTVVYADKITKEEADESGEAKTKHIPFLKTYAVFNVEQIEGLPEAFYKAPEVKLLNSDERILKVDDFFSNTKAVIRKGGKAAYNETQDQILMPPYESFYEAKGYYATLAHELTHWTKHSSRLNRDMGRTRYGDEGYAKEELVAELGSCFLAADLGLEPESREDHAAYIQSWLKVLKDDKKFIFTAASFAQRAVEYIASLQNK
jgi:antirestriction protein ArdC